MSFDSSHISLQLQKLKIVQSSRSSQVTKIEISYIKIQKKIPEQWNKLSSM